MLEEDKVTVNHNRIEGNKTTPLSPEQEFQSMSVTDRPSAQAWPNFTHTPATFEGSNQEKQSSSNNLVTVMCNTEPKRSVWSHQKTLHRKMVTGYCHRNNAKRAEYMLAKLTL